MRYLAAVLWLFLPAAAAAEPPLTFNHVTFGQLPDAEMICIKGPCSTEPIRPDIDSNRIDFAEYVKPVDITTFGGWEITSPKYMFFEDRLARVAFRIVCGHRESLRCIDEVTERLDQELGLQLVENLVESESRETGEEFAEFRSYAAGEDSVVLVSHKWGSGTWQGPSVILQSRSIMKDLRQQVRRAARK